MIQNSQHKQMYEYAVGRRKSAIARIRLYKDKEAKIIINGKTLEEYFSSAEIREQVISPLALVHKQEIGMFEIKVSGGGKCTQAESIRHGIARVLILVDPDLRPTLKKAGFLHRDPRVKERKKPGLKKARRAPQWQKR